MNKINKLTLSLLNRKNKKFVFQNYLMISIENKSCLTNKNLLKIKFQSSETKYFFKLNEYSDLGILRFNMEPVIEKCSSLWINIFNQKPDSNDQRFIVINKVKIPEDNASEFQEFLWDEFSNTKQNIYQMHLDLIKHFQSNTILNYDACVLFLNRTFEAWWKQQLNRLKKKNNCHLIANCTDNDCLCALNNELILKAFDIALKKNMSLLTSMNKIYKFEENFELLKPKIEESLSNLKGASLVKLISELKLNDIYPIDYEKVFIPMMIEDKFQIIDEIVSTNEKTLISFVEVCNKLCNNNTNFKKIAENHELKKSHNFSGSKIAKYASNCLKKVKKTHLIQSQYPGIIFQLKLNQLRYFVNSRYRQSSEVISFHGWAELIIDLIRDDELLIIQLFFEIVNYNKDVLIGIYFMNIYGNKYIERLPSQSQEFFNENYKILISDYQNKILNIMYSNSKESCYWPDSLKFEDLVFVDNTEKFVEMLNFFESFKPDIIGFDCEWKPIMDSEDLADIEVENNSSKNKRPNILQIATRQKVFVIEVKDLVDNLEDSLIDRFGSLVLFSDKLIKLGFEFDQDSKKLYHLFPKFNHVFSEFTESVIHINKVVTEFEKKWELFSNNGKNPSKSKSLTKLTQSCFGKPLDKSECMSNWQNKPLRKEQLKYAALDAYVLIEIHDFIQQRIKELGVEFDFTSNKSIF